MQGGFRHVWETDNRGRLIGGWRLAAIRVRWGEIKTVDLTWRNIAKGHEKVLELELRLQSAWGERVRQAQQQKHQADLDAWSARQEQRKSEYQRSLAAWAEEVANRNSRLRDEMNDGIRRAPVAIPVSVAAAVVVALLGIIDIGAVQLVLLGVFAGFIIAFGAAAWNAVKVAELRSRKPSLMAVEDPIPQPEKQINLVLADRWWQQIGDDGTRQRKAVADHGDVGEEEFFGCLKQGLSDNHVGVRGILVKRRLDVDLLVAGPTNVWVFEVKHWSGTIVCRNGRWWRAKSYYSDGSIRHQEQAIDAFDQQWLREQREVQETLRRRVRPEHLASMVTGGLVLTHPTVSLDIDASCKCGYGPPRFWTSHLQEAESMHEEIISQQSRLRILDALLDRAEKVNYAYVQRNCCIELAERLAEDMTAWAKNYVARHESP